MNRTIIITAAFLAMTSVILGAFGAHALKNVIGETQLVSFETGVRYQMYHALMLLFIDIAPIPHSWRNAIFYFALSGVLLFSGSIYLLATKDLTGIDIQYIGFITPIGGLLLIFSWLALLYVFLSKKNIKSS
ncbi:MAG TPA: DUF423 domain-containing protein [Flavobacterium sp.]|nr:DUF423 domain-containing protein [Flavobacterium sp.]